MSTNISQLMFELEAKLSKEEVRAMVLDLLGFGQATVYGGHHSSCELSVIRAKLHAAGFSVQEADNYVLALVVAGERTVVARRTEQALSRSADVSADALFGPRDKRMDH